MNLREKAKAAYQEEMVGTEEKEIQKRRHQSKETARLALEIFGVKPDKVDGLFATIDGLRFRRGSIMSRGWLPASVTDRGHFGLLGTCPRCKQRCSSWPIHNLADLGQMLESFRPQMYHHCESFNLWRWWKS